MTACHRAKNALNSVDAAERGHHASDAAGSQSPGATGRGIDVRGLMAQTRPRAASAGRDRGAGGRRHLVRAGIRERTSPPVRAPGSTSSIRAFSPSRRARRKSRALLRGARPGLPLRQSAMGNLIAGGGAQRGFRRPRESGHPWCSSDRISSPLRSEARGCGPRSARHRQRGLLAFDRPAADPRSGVLSGRNGRWIDLEAGAPYRLLTPGPGLPALTIVHHGDGLSAHPRVLPDPLRDVLLVRFSLHGSYRLVLILAPTPRQHRP